MAYANVTKGLRQCYSRAVFVSSMSISDCGHVKEGLVRTSLNRVEFSCLFTASTHRHLGKAQFVTAPRVCLTWKPPVGDQLQSRSTMRLKNHREKKKYENVESSEQVTGRDR
jgi:hypothetical protein